MAPPPHPTVYLCRHGDTAWSPSRRFAGRTDIPLTPIGETDARLLGQRLKDHPFARVLTSPLQRARRTCELAGFGDRCVIDDRLTELDFGQYEGKTRGEITAARPGWTYLRDGCPGGEDADQIARRADAVIGDLVTWNEPTILFAHSVILRVLTARWLGLAPRHGSNFLLSPASVCVLSYDPVDDAPAVELWNDTSHLRPDPRPAK